MRAFTLLVLLSVLVVEASGDDQAKEKWESSTPAEELKQLQGKWRVAQIQGEADARIKSFPKGLTDVKSQLTLEGNALLQGGKVIATLANDLSELDIHDPALFRRPLLLVFPDGKALRCAYDKRHLDRSVDIAPPGIGNVGVGYRIYLDRRAEP